MDLLEESFVYIPPEKQSSREPFGSGISGSNSGVIVLPTQTMHYLGEVIQNHHVFALFNQSLQKWII